MTGPEPPNVLLVVMDSVRAANTSLHDHVHDTTPFLEEFADRSTVYTQARSPGTWSLPSHVSIFTGYHVLEHGVTRSRHRLEPGHTIFEELRDEHGYDTGVFSENTWITDMEVGLKDAFNTVEGARNLLFPEAVDPSNFVLSEGQGKYLQFFKYCLGRDDTIKSLLNGLYTKLAWDYPQLLPDRFTNTTHARVYRELFLEWIDDREGPWAACVNFMDAHLPYLPDSTHDNWGGKELRKLQDSMDDQVWEFNGGQRPWWQRKALEGLYDGTIRQVDAELERLVHSLENRGILKDTLLVVTSDHGEGFGEISALRGDKDSPRPNSRVSGHGSAPHEVLTHVPLVVKFPSQLDGRRVSNVASLTEFPDVVRGVVDDTPAESTFVPDERVVASAHGLEEPMEERAIRYTGDTYRFDGDGWAVYQGSGQEVHKFAGWRDRRATLHVPDATCRYRIGDDEEGVIDQLLDEISALGVREETDRDIDAATERRLEDLGYR